MESVTCPSSCSVVSRYFVSPRGGAIHGKIPLRLFYAFFRRRCIRLCLSLVGDVYGVGSVTIEGDGVARRFVECSLPEMLEGVRFPAEACAGETRAGIVEDAHLLAWRRCECCSALTRMEDAVVGDERRMDVEVTKVVHQKGEVANGMILSAPHRTEVGDARVALADAEPCGLREVVVVLFADEVEDVVVLLLERLGQ